MAQSRLALGEGEVGAPGGGGVSGYRIMTEGGESGFRITICMMGGDVNWSWPHAEQRICLAGARRKGGGWPCAALRNTYKNTLYMKDVHWCYTN